MRVTLLCLFFISLFSTQAQQRCASEELKSNQGREESEVSFENWLKQKKNQKKSSRTNSQQQTIYQVPVVFHIIHDGSSIGNGSNLSDSKLFEQMDILNADFRRTNADSVNTPTEFLGVAADAEIEFVLAKQDPEGLPTTGIVRLKGTRDSYDPRQHDELIKSESFWDQDLYINIYVTDLDGFLGAAQFPFSNIPGSELKNYKSTDGLLMDYEYIGVNKDTQSFDSYGRTLSHEMGHYLGLKHIWGDGGCSFDDFCADTPFSANSTNGCPNEKETCGSRDMIQNYMDYTDDVCMNLFTECQKSRMRAVLEQSPRRASLLSSPGLQEPTMVSNDLGIRSIIAPNQVNCETLVTPSVELRNYGTDVISSFEIALFSNGNMHERKTISNTIDIGMTSIVTFDQLVLTADQDIITFLVESVNNTIDNNVDNNDLTIIIQPFESEGIPYAEDFETNVLSGFVENGASSKWQVTSATKETLSNTAAYLPFFDQDENFGYRDILTTATLDLSALTSVQLNFDYAYAARSSQETDGLIVIVSTDCGASFSKNDIVFERYGLSLATRPITNSEFIPLASSDWENISLNLTKFAGEEYVKIGFMGVNAGGNNIYLDDIGVTSANLLAYDVGIKNIENLPLVSCETLSKPVIEIKNFGFETINILTMSTTINGIRSEYTFERLSIASGRSDLFTIDISDQLVESDNEFVFTIESINNTADLFEGNNTWSRIGLIENTQELIPIREDFEPLTWNVISPQGTDFFEITRLNGDDVLVTQSFENDTIGQSMIVSPVILTGDYKEGGIRFNYSYAQRIGFNDNLKVLLSTNCGKTYDVELISLNAPQLAITNQNEEWIPEEGEWKKQFIDISEYMIWQELRVAFVFTNGNGNRLYLDDIDILTTSDPDLPEFENPVMLYPNPAVKSFNVALNLQHKQTINIRLMDMSGRVVFDKPFPNSINQTLEFQAPSQSGFYVLQVTGENNLNQIKRIFIRQ